MQDPTLLFSYEHTLDMSLRARTLVVTLGGYIDAGRAQRVLDKHLLHTLSHRLVGRFDADQVFDYAGHRPPIVFDKDHFESFHSPEITLRLVEDAAGQPFLLLSGPEPSLQWERFAAAIARIIERFDVKQTVIAQGFPAPAPHTKPILVTMFGTDPTQLPIGSSLAATFQMSASFTSLLTLRLGEMGHSVIGLSAHVPHYLAGMEYPAGGLALLRGIVENTGLNLPVGELGTRAAATDAEINQTVSGYDELRDLIEQLESQYETMLSERVLPVRPEEIPSADELGAEFERFLRSLDSGDSPDTLYTASAHELKGGSAGSRWWGTTPHSSVRCYVKGNQRTVVIISTDY
ncbi:MAG: PAC2 family protein [Propionibacteriaceae bacterium]|jgi:hypothetical protein|nr:PAC2 family protein [Propionibacteriaceae bacterium]